MEEKKSGLILFNCTFARKNKSRSFRIYNLILENLNNIIINMTQIVLGYSTRSGIFSHRM